MPSHMFPVTFEKLYTPDAYCNYKYKSISLKLKGSWLVGGLWELNKMVTGSLLFLANSCPTEQSNIQHINVSVRYDTELKETLGLLLFCKLKILDVLFCSGYWALFHI